MVGLHLKKHGGSTEKSLAAIPAGGSTRQTLERIADTELAASLALLPARHRRRRRDASQDRPTGPAACRPASTWTGPIQSRRRPITSRMATAAIDGSAGRYQLLGEIARGGMGAVLKGRDPDLGRDLALKVLLDRHRDRPDLVHRFVEEAQICGQLQHPGVVPVYELGTLADHRPFFTMKLVKGRDAGQRS